MNISENMSFNKNINKNNENYYLLQNLSQTLFQLSIPAIILRATSRKKLRILYTLISYYYIGYILRETNDDLINYGKKYENNNKSENHDV
jgi:hypothetical protein